VVSNASTIGKDYVVLAHQLQRYLKKALGEGTTVVDCYFGPPLSIETQRQTDPDDLLRTLRRLRKTVRIGVTEEPRRTFLAKQLDAMALLVRFALEEKTTFEERVRTGLDVDIVTVRSERIEELQEEAYRALLRTEQKADLATMAMRWRKRSQTTGDEVVAFAQEAARKARQSTQRLLFQFPETEEVEFRSVSDAPWSAYHHYQGNYHGLIEINIRLPKSKYGLWGWVTHETYPGHQTQLVARELGYNRGGLDLEATVAIINTPDCTVAEGLADSGTRILGAEHPLGEGEQTSEFLAEVRRAAGINALVMLQHQKRSETEALSYLIDAGALEEEYAKAQMRFMTDTVWAPYGFTYFVGGWLVRSFFEAARAANLLDEFARALYRELHTPSTLKSRIRELGLKLPPITG
jgi:hypothetical protein